MPTNEELERLAVRRNEIYSFYSGPAQAAAMGAVTDGIMSVIRRNALIPDTPPPVRARTVDDIEYPEIYEPNVVYLSVADDHYYACGACIPSNHFSTRNIDEVVNEIYTEMQRRFLNPSLVSFYPSPGSGDWQLLRNYFNFQNNLSNDSPMPREDALWDEEFLVPNEETMTERTSRAKPANEFSFIIRYNPENDRFIMTPPQADVEWRSNEGRMWIADSSANLEELYKKAKHYCAVARSYTQRSDWNVWPRKGSIPYELLANPECPNPTNIENFAALKKVFAEVKADPESKETEQKLKTIVRYCCWRLGRGNIVMNGISVRNRIAGLLERTLGTRFLTSMLGDFLFHPKNSVEVYLDNRKENKITTSKWGMELTENCTVCKCTFINDVLFKPTSKILACTDCLEQTGFFYCTNCPSTFHSQDDGCPELNRRNGGQLHGYSVDVRRLVPIMFSTKKDKPSAETNVMLRYGVELEVLRHSNVSMPAALKAVGNSVKKYAILKSDSSLGSEGFEIVTAPATLEFHRTKLWTEFFNSKNAAGVTASQHVQAWNTRVCGIHVHITRAALTKMQLAKLLVFYHEDVNNAFLSKIAGRTVGPSANYCRTMKKHLGHYTHEHCDDHHEAITISSRNRGKTAEVRIFRGNVTKHGIMRALEFVDATVKWCGTNGAKELSYRNFLAWFDNSQNRSDYPDLWKHLIQLGYLKTKHTTKGKESLELVPEHERVA